MPDASDTSGTSDTSDTSPGGTATPVIEGWFTVGTAPTLLGARCTTCGETWFPPLTESCPAPGCAGEHAEPAPLSRRGSVWSYTDARYQPPPPYVVPDGEYRPFALAAVELPEGIVVLGQLAEGYGVDDVTVGSQVELVVEPLHADDSGDRLIWRWRPVTELGEEAEQ